MLALSSILEVCARLLALSSSLGHTRQVPTTQPLDVEEELLWRSLMRLAITVPRAMSNALERSSGLNGTEYHVLMHLSEAPKRQLRMSDLAERTALSAGRMTRVVDDLIERGLVTKQPCPEDGRSMLATLTKPGLLMIKRAYPHLLASVRENLFDHITADEAAHVGSVLKRLTDAVDAANPPQPYRGTKQAPTRGRKTPTPTAPSRQPVQPRPNEPGVSAAAMWTAHRYRPLDSTETTA